MEGQIEEAIQDLNQSIEINPEHALSYRSRALAYTMLGLDAEAEVDLNQATNLGVDGNTLTAAIEEIKGSR